jgi:hypothetical protein
MYRKSAAALCAVVLMGLGAGGAFAGEVTGPPGSGNEKDTSHSNSICSFSGLNDGNAPGGQTQSYGQDVSSGRADPRDKTTPQPGKNETDVSCQGGSNPDNPNPRP